jgi:hypothetical protein
MAVCECNVVVTQILVCIAARAFSALCALQAVLFGFFSV